MQAWHLPDEHVLDGTELFFEYDAQLVRKVLDELVMDKAMITQLSRQVSVGWNFFNLWHEFSDLLLLTALHSSRRPTAQRQSRGLARRTTMCRCRPAGASKLRRWKQARR